MSTIQLILDILNIVFLILLWKIYPRSIGKFSELCGVYKIYAVSIHIILMITIFMIYVRFL